jgi:hypothetical protein
MKKTINAPAITTFGLADFPSGERTKLEIQIIERALARWQKKQRFQSFFKRSVSLSV